MILLDTHVLSEPLRVAPNANVLAWIDAQAIETLFLSAICLAELRFGIAALPQGRRRETLQSSLDQLVAEFQAPHLAVQGFNVTSLCGYAGARPRFRQGHCAHRWLHRGNRAGAWFSGGHSR